MASETAAAAHDFTRGPLEWYADGRRYSISTSWDGIGKPIRYELREFYGANSSRHLGSFPHPAAARAYVLELTRRREAWQRSEEAIRASLRKREHDEPAERVERFTLRGVAFELTPGVFGGAPCYWLSRPSSPGDLVSKTKTRVPTVAAAIDAACRYVETLPPASSGIVRPRGVPALVGEAPGAEPFDLRGDAALVRESVARPQQRAAGGIAPGARRVLSRLAHLPGPGFAGPLADPARFRAGGADQDERHGEQDRDEAAGHPAKRTAKEGTVLELKVGERLVVRVVKRRGGWGSRRWHVLAVDPRGTGAVHRVGRYRRELSAWRHASAILDAVQGAWIATAGVVSVETARLPLRSQPVRFAVFDELDRFPGSPR